MGEEQQDDSESHAPEAAPELRAIAWELREVIRRLDDLANQIQDLASAEPDSTGE